MAMKVKINNSEIHLVQGDIIEQATDAIVNAANSRLILGEGVAGAIRRKGGPQIQAECGQIGGTPVGTAVITSGGRLKAKHVIHAVGPRMGEGDEDQKLRNATLSSLKLADENGLRSLSFPAISTGIFGCPVDRCASNMLGTVINYLKGATGLHQVVFCLFSSDVLAVFQKELEGFAQSGFPIQK
jgi:O-acetyl-ADP-ribose deacetylase (regulator of RNase III)